MANIQSSKKSIRKTAKVTARRKAEKSRMKTASKKLQALKKSGNAEKATSAAKTLMSMIDKAKKHGVLHKNKASRLKSRLSSLIQAKKGKEGTDSLAKTEEKSVKNTAAKTTKKAASKKKTVAKSATRSKATKR